MAEACAGERHERTLVAVLDDHGHISTMHLSLPMHIYLHNSGMLHVEAVDALVTEAGAGGRHERTLVAVLGDHGQIFTTHLSLPMHMHLRYSGVARVQAVDAVVAEAGTGGAHERTLVAVLGDHGQTAGGEHGGGTRAETDTVLLALNASALRRGRTLYASTSL